MLLVGCGGGSSNTDDSFSHSSFEFSFNGTNSKAVLDKENASNFLASIFLSGFILTEDSLATSSSAHSDVSSYLAPGNFTGLKLDKTRYASRGGSISNKIIDTEDHSCNSSGHYSIKYFSSSTTEYQMRIEYVNCIEGMTGELNGIINISYVHELYDGQPAYYPSSGKMTYSNFSVNTGVNRIEVTGSVDMTFLNYCPQVYVHNLIIRNTSTLEQTRYENLTTNVSCNNQYTMEGRIYSSNFGYIDVSTQKPLEYSRDNQLIFPDIDGNLKLSGKNSLVEVDFSSAWHENSETITYISPNYYGVLPTTTFRFDLDGDHSNDYILSSPTEYALPFFTGGTFLDSDGDKMLDIWEDFYGLDRYNPDDADIDSDSDGYSNYGEYIGFGHPRDSLIPPEFKGTATTFIESDNSADVRKGQDLTLNLKTQINSEKLPGSYFLKVQVSENAEFIQPSNDQCAEYYLENSKKVCLLKLSVAYSNGTNERTSMYKLIIQSLDETPIDYVIEPDYGYFSNQNYGEPELSSTITFQKRLSDLELTYFSPTTSYKFDHLTVGQIELREIEFANNGPDQANNVVIRVTFPPEISVESAYMTFEQAYLRWQDCEVMNNQVICRLDQLPSTGWNNEGTIRINEQANTDGLSTVYAKIESDSVEVTNDNNLNSTEVFLGNSLDTIQPLIDQAEPGDTVLIPQGYYTGGSLMVDGKALHLYSENGLGSVKIGRYGASFLNEGKIVILDPETGSTINGFIFIGPVLTISGTVTVSNNKFYSNFYSAAADNSIDDCSPSMFQINPTLNSVIEKNYFDCTLIEAHEYDWYDGHTDLTIRNNIFNTNPNTGTSLDTSAFIYFTGVGMYNTEKNGVVNIINNTFLNSDNPALFTIPGANMGNISEIKNNIFYNVAKPIVHTGSYETEFSIEGNIFGAYNEILPNLPPSNLFGDPQIDPVSFYPLQNSIVIDSGVSISGLISDYLGNIRPRDGNNDGNPEIDIGAIELQ